MHIDRTKLYKNFINIKNVANVNILICYKNLFSINGIKFNIGNYIIIVILIFLIISFIIFYAKQYRFLQKKIKDIVFAIKNSSLKNKITDAKKMIKKKIKGQKLKRKRKKKTISLGQKSNKKSREK